ncbi:hypothetical protein [Nonomuraea sp. SBT364]|nr:hypothetical protein [Nonomuraea sp. SBT364]
MAGSYLYPGFDQGAAVRDDPEPAQEWLPGKSVADFRRAIPGWPNWSSG